MGDLFLDLQDGLNLISLLEVLSGEHLVSTARAARGEGGDGSGWGLEDRPGDVPMAVFPF